MAEVLIFNCKSLINDKATARQTDSNSMPSQKWLKDRKDRRLEFDDIFHYQKIIVALTQTDRLMKEIDKVGVE